MNEENRNTQTFLAGDAINEKEKLRQTKKAEMRKKYRIITALLIGTIILAILFFPVYDEWSDWSTSPPIDSGAKVEVAFQYRTQRLVETTNQNPDGNLIGQYQVWTDYGSWGNWQEEEIQSNESCEVESDTLYRFRKVYTETGYSEWSAWGKWSTTEPAKSDLVDVEMRTAYKYGLHRFRIVNTGKIYDRFSITILAYCRKFGNHTEEQLDIIRTALLSGVEDEDTIATMITGSGVVYEKKTLLSEKKNLEGEVSVSGSTWYIDSDKSVQEVPQYRSRTRTVESQVSYSEWSEYTKEPLAADADTEVDSNIMYRCRNRYLQTVYQYQMWNDWSDIQSDYPILEADAEVQVATMYRYAERHFLWEKLLERFM